MFIGNNYGTLQMALLFYGSKKRGKRSKAVSETLNNQEFMKQLNNLEGITIGRFNWDFPKDSILHNQDYFIERTLLYNTRMIYYNSKKLGKKVLLPANGLGDLNLFGNYNKYKAFAMNGFEEIVDADDCVVLWDRIDRNTFTYINIILTAERLADIQRTCDVRMNNHKKPIIWGIDQDTIASFNKMYEDLTNNVPAIPLRNDMFQDDDKIKPLQMINDANFLNNDLFTYSQKILNNYYCQMGIDYNPETGKKERLVTDEVQSNNEQVENNRYVYLYPRQLFCEQVKEKFGDDIKVEYVLTDEEAGDYAMGKQEPDENSKTDTD